MHSRLIVSHEYEFVTGYPAVLTALADRGWSDDDLAKVAHRNAIRVLRDAEAVARELQSRHGPSTVTIEELDGAALRTSGA